MKLVIAYIRPERLNAVKQELANRDIRNISVSNALGSGRQRGGFDTYRGVLMEVSMHKKVRLEIGVNDDFVEPTVAAISAGGKTGAEGDGVIFILECAGAIRIRTLENGPAAMG